MRRAFTSCVYLRNEGAILLILHKRFNLWVPVGGELEANECPIDGARREVREETGITALMFPRIPEATVIPGTPDGLMAYEEHLGPPSKGWHMNFAFLADVSSRDVPKPNDEFTLHHWFTGDEPELNSVMVPPNVTVLVRRALEVYP